MEQDRDYDLERGSDVYSPPPPSPPLDPIDRDSRYPSNSGNEADDDDDDDHLGPSPSTPSRAPSPQGSRSRSHQNSNQPSAEDDEDEDEAEITPRPLRMKRPIVPLPRRAIHIANKEHFSSQSYRPSSEDDDEDSVVRNPLPRSTRKTGAAQQSAQPLKNQPRLSREHVSSHSYQPSSDSDSDSDSDDEDDRSPPPVLKQKRGVTPLLRPSQIPPSSSSNPLDFSSDENSPHSSKSGQSHTSQVINLDTTSEEEEEVTPR